MILVRMIVRELQDRDLLDRAKKIARAHHVTIDEMLGDDRSQPAVFARHQFWWELDNEGIWSISRMAKLVGRSRAAIRNGINAHARRARTEAA